ncbi:ATP-binding cassette domain-containing protein [Salmonella enterica subsp. houtenae]|nr:ATP-binding cassette domain-containing protein [Salmonella enterica subsp. houtenae]HDC2132809.1 ATP-binding cassette domain-containing protein [Salmonella enterica]
MKMIKKNSLLTYINSLMDSKGKLLFYSMLAITSLSSVIISLSPLLLAKITDALSLFLSGKNDDFNFKFLSILAFLYVLCIIFNKISIYIFMVLQSSLRISMQKALSLRYLKELYKENINELNKNNAGFTTQSLNQASNDIYILVRNVAQNILSPLIQLLSTIFIVLSTHDWFSAGVFFTYVIIFVSFNTKLTDTLATLRKSSMDITLRSYSLLSDTVDNMMGAKKNNALKLISDRYDDALTQENNAQKKYWNFSAWVLLFNSGLAIILFGTVFIYNISGVINGNVSIGHFIMITSYIILLSTPVENIGSLLSEIRQSMSSLAGFVNRHASSSENVSLNSSPKEKSEVNLSLNNLSFGYHNDKKILNNINLNLSSGKMYSFTGPSGAGKSTLVKLISGYYNDYSGDILFNETSLRYIDDEQLNETIYHLTQDDYIFMDTLRFNLQLARYEASENEMLHVLKLANLSVINNEAVSLDTQLISKGNNYSGGQKQRISLARLFLRKPAVIIIDEATSALDYINEAEIMSSVRTHFPDALIINISHRVNLLEGSDYVYVLNEGNIVASGQYRDLKVSNEYISGLAAAAE